MGSSECVDEESSRAKAQQRTRRWVVITGKRVGWLEARQRARRRLLGRRRWHQQAWREARESNSGVTNCNGCYMRGGLFKEKAILLIAYFVAT